MNTDLWGEEEPFSDIPEAAQTNYDGTAKAASSAPSMPPPRAPRQQMIERPIQAPEEVPEVAEEFDFEQEEESYEDILSDAHLRLEQGHLYKMIMNHNLFEGMDVDPKAVVNVQREIRNFAKERMEVMLGMRKDTSTVETLEIDFPFNELEVTVLKAMANTFSKGATENSDNYVPTVKRVTQEAPVARKTLNPIGSPPRRQAPKQQKPLANTPKAPVSRPSRQAANFTAEVDRLVIETGMPREAIERALLEKNEVLNKPGYEMTGEELAERNRVASRRRQTSVKAANAIPPATPEQMMAKAQEHASAITQGFNKNPLMSQLLDAVKAMPISPK
jgi:hypothetical protein